ncbi:MAG TPA: hypothetical protein ENH95_02960 [Nitrosopumilus sp.]|nr:hypothetical protein [Nitrosopumilus sp.]
MAWNGFCTKCARRANAFTIEDGNLTCGRCWQKSKGISKVGDVITPEKVLEQKRKGKGSKPNKK